MRQKEHLGLWQERGGSGAPRGKWLPRLCHISCRCYQRCFHQDASKVFRRRNDRNCVKNGACCRQEKTRHVAVRRHDTLCVRGVFSLFLLEQRLAEFDDINYVGKTTLIVTINISPFQLQQWLGHANLNTTLIYVHVG